MELPLNEGPIAGIAFIGPSDCFWVTEYLCGSLPVEQCAGIAPPDSTLLVEPCKLRVSEQRLQPRDSC